MGLMFPGDLLCGMFKAQQSCTAEAVTDLEVLEIPHDAFQGLFGEVPKLERVLFLAALYELEACRDWMLFIRGSTAYQRLAGFLQLLARQAVLAEGKEKSNAGSARFTLPLPRREIGCVLDMTMETVSRQMALMRRRSVIELEGPRGVIIPDVSALAEDRGEKPEWAVRATVYRWQPSR